MSDLSAADDAFILDEDTGLVVAAPGVLANDSDNNGAALFVLLVSDVSNGLLLLDADGSFIYSPAPDFNGIDSFTYVVTDGTSESNAATVTLTVSAVNDPPVTLDDEATVDETVPTLIDVLANDSDPDGDGLELVDFAVLPTFGTVAIVGSQVRYTATDGAGGQQDFFRYIVTDGQGGFAQGNVTIFITDIDTPPAAADDSATTESNVPVLIAVLSNDVDDGEQPLIVVIVDAPANGSVAVQPDGQVLYTPDPGFAGTDSFTYVANDGTFDSNVATVTIGVGEEPPPADLGFRFSNGSFGAGLKQAPPAVFDGFAVTQANGATLVEATGVWNAVKNVASPTAGWSAALGSDITIANFVDARLDFRNAGSEDLSLTLVGAKRGEAFTAAGDDRIEIVFHSNGGTFRETFVVKSGAGDDVIIGNSVGTSLLDDLYLADNANPGNGRLWNPDYDGRLSVLEVDAGDGNDVVIALDVRLVALGGTGDDILIGGSRDDVLDGGAGADIHVGGAGRDTFILRAGETVGDIITDFTFGEDLIRLLGFGGGAGLVEEAPGFYQVQDAGGASVGTFFAASGLVVGVDAIFA